MSFGFAPQVPGAPPLPPVGVPVHCPAVATQSPVAMSQTGPIAEPAHCESCVQGPHVFGFCEPQIEAAAVVHCVLVQQLPGVQVSAGPPVAQQMSAGFAHAPFAFVQVAVTHRPPPPVLQMVPAPYDGSVWHCVSVLQTPQKFPVVTPQIWPAVQFASEWQLPGSHAPPAPQMYGLFAPP
jgi:hypothetical protein